MKGCFGITFAEVHGLLNRYRVKQRLHLFGLLLVVGD